ncbi:heavy metal translocating P-type ATPase [Nonlabens tegetincola]|uniref:heavy metal translocating P-type ATPase n=1 Tax=Nonlabens tegetincola TaxID=323273 RepID=UPI000CF38F7E|nr:heavy metal translocating P-type ATPase metal-binding domain-containing protein [Nonlabens tegetincola]PQJ14044.1 ATPase [Nonlabens tegetincola]
MEKCFHCGDPCITGAIEHDHKVFCCHGCKTVYDILNENNLSYYYDLEQHPGVSPRDFEGKFDFLENQDIVNSILEFNEQDTQIVQLLIPSMHCSSCIWVLEHLHKINPAVTQSQVNFPEKTVRIVYQPEHLNLKSLVILLSNLGYEPYISLEDSKKSKKVKDRSLIYKLGVAGFAFGNIMFLSFPEYFEVNEYWLDQFKHVFRWLMLAFSIPVVFYSGVDYFISAFKGIKSRILNIDVPIAIGISVLFLRSLIEIIMDWGTGFLDSLAGLVFFLLLGKFFQQKTYAYLSFERDYKSYFPIGVTKIVKPRECEELRFRESEIDNTINQPNKSNLDREVQTPVYELQPGDRILIRNGELIPVDAILIKGKALIDYSFVTGEAQPVPKQSGDKIYAGGRQESGLLELEVIKGVEQSYLTQLWSNEIFKEEDSTRLQSITDRISKRFTIGILSVAIIAALFWLFYDNSMALNVFTAVLIVACPCAIALAAPFTLGNVLRFYGKVKLYLKNSHVIEKMSELDTIIFDKTGTLTSASKNTVHYEGIALDDMEKQLLSSTLKASNHPLSRSLYKILQENNIQTLDTFQEHVGQGITGSIASQTIKIGSARYVGIDSSNSIDVSASKETAVHIATDSSYKGCYIFQTEYRPGMAETFKELEKSYQIVVLSGDNEGELQALKKILPESTRFLFNQRPDDKMRFVKELQNNGSKVMMIGDGLNDAGALKQSDVGIAISENVNVFSPACDGIIDASQFHFLPQYLQLANKARSIISYAFIFSLLYNLIGLGFAVTGHLKPVIAAILMPLSSISIVVFTTLFSYYASNKIKP